MDARRTFVGVALVAGLAALTLSTSVGLVGCGGGADGAAEGARGQRCYPNDTCNAGLDCKNDRCVEGPAGTGGEGGAGSTSPASGPGGAGGSSSKSSTGATGGSGGAPPPANQPPIFLSFGTDVSSITDGQAVTLSAVLTDPDGIDDIIGGTLVDGSGATYGAFATSGQEGAYQISITWDEFNQVTPIDFAYGATTQRVLTARFFDQAGHSVEQSTTLTLTCNGKAACDGTCTDTTKSASNCGTCGHACDSGHGCYDGKCGKLSACLPIANSCSAACAAKGKVCKDLCGSESGEIYYHQMCPNDGASYGVVLCSQQVPDGVSMKCCCF
jgi:hypothetical protein